MAASLVISLRETLEASLVVGIALALLHRTRNQQYNIVVWLGVAAGIILSIGLALLLHQFTGGLAGRAREIYEGITMLIAAGLISWMVLWMTTQGKNIRGNIEGKVETHLKRGQILGLFFLTFVSVLREGVETVIFLQAAIFQTSSVFHHVGIVSGFAIAIGLAILLYRGLLRWFPLHRFFQATSVLLMIFAIGLALQGIQELQEALA